MSMRELKGQDIANRFRIVKSGNLWLVPSQSSKKQYKVDPVAQSCTCPDFEYTGFKCKHQYAVEFTIEHDDGQSNRRLTLVFYSSVLADLPRRRGRRLPLAASAAPDVR